MLQSERLMFRKYTMDDLDFYASLLSNPAMMKFIGEGKTINRAEAKEKLTHLINVYHLSVGLGVMLAFRKTDGVYIGHAGLVPQTVNGKIEIELGYWINQPYWNKGYATESASAFRDFGLKSLGLYHIISIIQKKNHQSINVAKNIGMILNREIIYNSNEVYIYQISNK